MNADNRPDQASENEQRLRALIEDRLGSVNFVAGHLDISRQAMLAFMQAGEFPVTRALQIEKMSNKRIPWEELSPGAAQTVADTPVLVQ